MATTENMKRCKFCGEEILAVASKCKHCSSNLDEVESESIDELKPKVDYGMFLLLIPVVTSVLIWGWVTGLNLFQSPGSKMSLLLIATILGTAIVAAMEASKIGMKSNRKKGTYSAIKWFFVLVCIWGIAYPMYLYKRKHYGLKNHLLVGIVLVCVFLFSYISVAGAIDARVKEVRGKFEKVKKDVEKAQDNLKSLGY